MPGIRTFVAVEVDEASRRELARLLTSFRASQADVKWVSPENLHLTLKFLGDIPPEAIGEVVGRLDQVSRGVKPFRLRLGGLGAFPTGAAPRVVWVGVTEGRAELSALAAKVEEALADSAARREERPFSAHLTLGRVRSPRNRERLQATMSRLKDFAGPGATVNRMVLFSSDLRPTGPIYTPIASHTFLVGGPIPEGGCRDG